MSPYWTEYTYDPLGNRTSMVQHGIGADETITTEYEHGEGEAGPHQLTSMAETVGAADPTSTTFTYDEAGNRVSKTVGTGPTAVETAYGGDVEGELVVAGGEVYSYDASGNRMLRESSAGVTVYVPGGQELLIAGEDVSATRYYSFAGRMVAMRTSGGFASVTSFVADHQGTLVAAVPNTNWAANAVERVYTDPFGGKRGGSDALPGDRGFLGAVEDATGLALLGARYYDSQVGSFISVDPLLSPGVPAQFNAYVYSGNSPVTWADPSGLFWGGSKFMIPDKPTGSSSGGSGASSGGGSSGVKKPQSTSWAALNACKDVWCTTGWNLQFAGHFYGGILEGLAGLAILTCGPCMAATQFNTALEVLRDPTAHMARYSEEFGQFWSDPVGNFWRPFGEDWANNPGHALGGTVFTAATFAVPGGALIKAGSAARAANNASVGMAGVRTAGLVGEQAAGIVKNTQRIPSASGTAAYRVPDELTATSVGEVKNVTSLSYTNQLRDFAAYAQQEGIVFNLYVRGSTKLSDPLQDAVNGGGINLIRSLP